MIYIFKYRRISDNQVIGYHLSTLCQMGDKEKAKIYKGINSEESLEKQRKVIQNNLNNVLSTTRENPGNLFNLYSIKERQFGENAKPNDYIVESEETTLEPGVSIFSIIE